MVVEYSNILNFYKHLQFQWLQANLCITSDTPPNSLMDSIVSPKVKKMEGEGVGARSLAHSTLGVEGRAGAPRRD
jgi:hypothetical protein